MKLIIGLILFFSFDNVHAKIEYSNCSSDFKKLVNWSVETIAKQLDRVFADEFSYYIDRETGQTSSFEMKISPQHQYYINWLFKYKGFKVNCWDAKSQPACLLMKGVTPIHKQGEALKEMYICESLRMLQNPCEMLMIFYHEFGHVALLPMTHMHNLGLNASYMVTTHDVVYKFGEAIYSMCRSYQ